MKIQRMPLAVIILIVIWGMPLSPFAADFSPNGCEYSVSFPSVPEKYSMQKATQDGMLVSLHGAQLTIRGGGELLRAECGSAHGIDLTQFNDQNMTFYMVEITKDLGLSRPNIEVSDTALGKTGVVTGVKDTERGRITVRVINIIGDTSILTLYLTAFSKNFMTPEMQIFLDSVRSK